MGERAPVAPAELPFSPEVLGSFADVVRRRLGLAQAGRNPDALARRLHTALQLAGASVAEAPGFVRALASAEEGAPALLAVADAVPNRETSFFRDADQLGRICRELLPALAAVKRESGPLRVLSAGCATGEEPYSLAMLALDQLHRLWGRSVMVTGIDVSPQAIDQAREALFSPSTLTRAGEGPAGWRTRYLREEEAGLRVRDGVRAVTEFHRGNVVVPSSLEALPRFDVVLCRNLLIYFDPPTFVRATQVLLDRLLPDGVLILGHAETGMAAQLGMTLERQDDLAHFRSGSR